MSKRHASSPDSSSSFKQKRSSYYKSLLQVTEEREASNEENTEKPKKLPPIHFNNIINQRSGENGKPLSLADLPHPSKMHHRRKAHSSKGKYQRKKFSIVENYLQQLKKKQSDFLWTNTSYSNDDDSSFFESSATDDATTDHVVPYDTVEGCSFFDNNHGVAQQSQQQQNVPSNTTTASLYMVSSQQVSRSPVQQQKSYHHSGYRQFSMLQHQVQNNHSIIAEANRYLTTGEVNRESIEYPSSNKTVGSRHISESHANRYYTTGEVNRENIDYSSYKNLIDPHYNESDANRYHVTTGEVNRESIDHLSYNNNPIKNPHHRHKTNGTNNKLFSFDLPYSDIYPDVESDDEGEEETRDELSPLDSDGLLRQRVKKRLFNASPMKNHFELNPFKTTASSTIYNHQSFHGEDSANNHRNATYPNEALTTAQEILPSVIETRKHDYDKDGGGDSEEIFHNNNSNQVVPQTGNSQPSASYVCGIQLPPDLEHLESLINLMERNPTQK